MDSTDVLLERIADLEFVNEMLKSELDVMRKRMGKINSAQTAKAMNTASRMSRSVRVLTEALISASQTELFDEDVKVVEVIVDGKKYTVTLPTNME